MQIKVYKKGMVATNCHVGPNRQNAPMVSNMVTVSTTGYSLEIFCLQCEHRPRKKR